MEKLSRLAPTLARFALGLPMTLIPISYFFGLAHPPHEGEALRAVEAFVGTGYLMDLVKATELAAGLALLANRFVPLALVVLAPVMVNILAFHLFLEPGTIAFPAVLAALQAYLGYAHRGAFAPMMRARAESTPAEAKARGGLTESVA